MDSKSTFDNNTGINLDVQPPTIDKPGINMDYVPALNDEPAMNSDSAAISYDDPTLSTGTLFRCINCSLDITRMRRHSLELVEVQAIIRQWIAPHQVQRDSLLCQSCWDLVWIEIRQPSSYQNTRPVGHRRVCINCGRSLLRSRSHILTISSERESNIRNVIAEWIIPRQLRSMDRICHPCWQRSDRAAANYRKPSNSQDSVETQDTQREVQNVATDATILLPNYKRAPNTQRACFFPGCSEQKLLTVPTCIRARLFCDFNYYVPPNCKICQCHLKSNSWNVLSNALNPIQTFTAMEIEDFAALLKHV